MSCLNQGSTSTYGSGVTYGSGLTYASPESTIFGYISYFDPVTPAVGESVEQNWVSIEIEHTEASDFSLQTLTLHVNVSNHESHGAYEAPIDRSCPEDVSVIIEHTTGSDFVLQHLWLEANMRTHGRPNPSHT